MKTYHFAEWTYRNINFSLAHKMIATEGLSKTLKLFNSKIKERVHLHAGNHGETRVACQVKACQKWFKADLIKEYEV